MKSRWLEDAGERMHVYHAAAWAFGACTMIAMMVAYYLTVTRQLGWLGAAGILLLGWLLAGAITWIAWRAAGLAGHALVNTLTAAGNLAPAPSFSFQESLIARGQFAEAAQAFQKHLELRPGDLHARLALAALWSEQLRNPDGAERVLLETRRLVPPAEIEYAIANALIDLYHASGQLGREMAELARFAERFAGTDAGSRARAALLRLKARGS